MQISIPLNDIQFEVRDGKLIFCPSESVELAKFVLDAIDTDLRTPTSEVYEILADRELIARAMDVADRLATLDRVVCDRELTDDELTELRVIQGRGIRWLDNAAKDLLNQDAVGRECWLYEVAERGPTDEDHDRLNWCRANGVGSMRDKAGELLLKLAGARK